LTVAILGGHNRFGRELKAFSKEVGVSIKFIERWCPKARESIANADFVIVLIGCVSHELSSLAKKLVKERCIFCHEKGLCNLRKLIVELKQLQALDF
jgi:hypothetical protein